MIFSRRAKVAKIILRVGGDDDLRTFANCNNDGHKAGADDTEQGRIRNGRRLSAIEIIGMRSSNGALRGWGEEID